MPVADGAFRSLPGGDLAEAGIRDLERGVESAAALLVASFAARLRRSGLDVPDVAIPDPEHRLYHYDFYAQALAEVERGEQKDLADVRELLARGLVERDRLWSSFRAIEPDLYRFPAISPPAFRRALEAAIGPDSTQGRTKTP